MPVKVTCTTCEKVINAPDAARGKAIRCPECQTKIAVPAESGAPKAVTASAKKRKAAAEADQPVDSEDALANLDFRKAEDKNARICPKCGFDMQYQDEEDEECPKCGYDSSVGGLGAKARKRAMKGPDPADFYPDLIKSSWKFVSKNRSLALRTILYTLVSLLFSLISALMYLWVSPWPPRAFLALCFVVSFLVIPGWMWVLDVETIKLSLERKDKFLASAMGVAFCAWCVAVIAPVVLVPAGLGYYFMTRLQDERAVLVIPVCLTLGLIPSILMLPVAMSHMAMIVPSKGWMVWELVPITARNIKPALLWLLLFVIMNIPAIAGLATIVVVSGPGLVKMATVMETNAENARKLFAQQMNPNTQKRGEPRAIQVLPEEPKEVDFQPLIIPCVILAVMAVVNGFTSLFLMRVNGQFTYFNKSHLGLIDRRKEKKYVSADPEDEDGADKPKKMIQLWGDAFAFFLVFDLLGFVAGFLYGWFTGNVGQLDDVFSGIAYGISGGHGLSMVALLGYSAFIAFQDSVMWGLISLFGVFPIGFLVFASQNFSERKGHIMRIIAGMAIGFVVTAATILLLPTPKDDALSMEAPPVAAGAENPAGGAAANPAAPAAK